MSKCLNTYQDSIFSFTVFPAGILQPPFYHRFFPKCLNYGGIGVVVGHEITHGFDDKGRLFDRNGNLQKWWSEQAISEFHMRAQCLIGIVFCGRFIRVFLLRLYQSNDNK